MLIALKKLTVTVFGVKMSLFGDPETNKKKLKVKFIVLNIRYNVFLTSFWKSCKKLLAINLNTSLSDVLNISKGNDNYQN